MYLLFKYFKVILNFILISYESIIVSDLSEKLSIWFKKSVLGLIHWLFNLLFIIFSIFIIVYKYNAYM